MTEPFYITTPIYYVNDVPHLGHAYTTIVCDTLARFHRMRGDDTRLLTGTDEHGQKVEEAATKRGMTPQQLVDHVAPRFDEMWRDLGIADYRFIRTTSANHKRVVATLWRTIRQRNPDDLYVATYQGWYCVGCEAFYVENQLVRDGDVWCCPTHKRPVAWLDKERSWFFRLSKYAEPLLAHIAAHPEFIRPEAYRNEVVAFLKAGLKDLSVSRTSFQWGIPVPEPDPEGHAHIIYVWMDALTNYLSDLCPDSGAIGGSAVDRYWPRAVHVIGKDILRFHAIYWPAFLMAAGLPLPAGIFAHGWWTVRGEKISKSIPATRIDPLVLADALGERSPLGRKLGIDAVRYYLLREVPLGNDGDFTFESLFGRFNADLANDLGNLINRSLTMITKFGGGNAAGDASTQPLVASLAAAASDAIRDTAAQLAAFAPSRALEQVWRFIGVANRFIDETQPWKLAKEGSPALAPTLRALTASLWTIARLIAPVLPATSHQLREWLGDDGELTWPSGLAAAPRLSPKPPQPLFPRLDDEAQTAILTRVLPDALAQPASPPQPTAAAAAPSASPVTLGSLTYDDFAKLELRVGRVVSATAVAKAKKLLHLHIDLGEARPRSIVAGIAEAYPPEQLIGRQVIVVANLAPATIRGITSEGMILAAGDDAIVGLSALDRDVAPGTRVR